MILLPFIVPFILVIMFAFALYAVADVNPSTAPLVSIVTLVNVAVLASMFNALQLVDEYLARGYKFLPVSLRKSHGTKFLPEDGAIRLPFSSLPGVGENAAINIVRARDEEEIFSVEDLQKRAGLTKSVIEVLRKIGVLDSLNETDQLSFNF